MDMSEINHILDRDEVIVKSYKPNRVRFILVAGIASLLLTFLIGGVIFTIGLLGLLDIIRFTNESGEKDTMGPFMMMIFGGVPILFGIISIVNSIFRYNKTLYVLTNKRAIIRTGVIGADYQSIRIKDISMINVQVDFLDKIVKPNTGTIIFASASTPIYNQNNKRNGAFTFEHVERPYEAYQEIKDHIDGVEKQ